MAQLIPGRPNIGGEFGTGLANTLTQFASSKLKEIIEGPRNKAFADAFLALAGQPDQQSQESAASLLQEPQQATQATTEAQLSTPGIQAQALKQPGGLTPEVIEGLKKFGLQQGQIEKLVQLDQQRKLRQATMSKEERKERRDLQRDIDKKTQGYYDSVIAGNKAATNNLKRLGRLEELSLKGELPPAELYKLLSQIEEHAPNPVYGAAAGSFAGGRIGALVGPAGAGIGAAIGGGLGAFLGPIAGVLKTTLARQYKDTEEFEKLSADFVRDAKGIFGGRITDADLRAFFQSVPTLNQTNEGRLKIIKNMKAFNEAARAEYDSMAELIKENGGERPNNLELLVAQRVKDKLDKAAQDFSV